MFPNPKDAVVEIRGVPYRKHVILADVNIPYKFSLDRRRNILFFCMNADEFSDQSFHSVVLNLETEIPIVVPGIRNGFASAVDQTSGQVFLGGSYGIFPYNYSTNDIDKPALIEGIDIFDMYHNKDLYFVDTSTQTLHVWKKGKDTIVPQTRDQLIHHFVVYHEGLFFVNPNGLFFIRNGSNTATSVDDGDIHYRGATVDTNGAPHFIAHDGIYAINEQSKRPEKILPIENGYGLSFDAKNNIVYGNERSVIKLIHY